MGVLIVEVWAVVPEVFLPCLSYQMGVSAKCLLAASHQHFVKRHYLLPLQTRGPLRSCLGCSLAKRQDVHQKLVSDAITWAWVRAQVQKRKKPLGQALVGRGCSLGMLKR